MTDMVRKNDTILCKSEGSMISLHDAGTRPRYVKQADSPLFIYLRYLEGYFSPIVMKIITDPLKCEGLFLLFFLPLLFFLFLLFLVLLQDKLALD